MGIAVSGATDAAKAAAEKQAQELQFAPGRRAKQTFVDVVFRDPVFESLHLGVVA